MLLYEGRMFSLTKSYIILYLHCKVLQICSRRRQTQSLGCLWWKLIFWFASAPAWIFSATSRYFIVRRRLFFFPTTKHPKVTRLAFDRSQVLDAFYAIIVLVIWCSFSMSGQFWLFEDMPALWSCGTRFRVINFRLLYLKNKWWKMEVYENPAPSFVFWLTRTRNSTSSSPRETWRRTVEKEEKSNGVQNVDRGSENSYRQKEKERHSKKPYTPSGVKN